MNNLKKPLLYALIISVVLGAMLGIVLVLRNTWGWFEIRVMLTTVIVAGASLCGLACDLSKTTLGLNLLPRAGLALTGITATLLLLGMWGDVDSEAYWKMSVSVSILAVATVHVSLLSIAKLAPKFRLVYFIGSQIVYGLALTLIVAVLGEINSSGLWRFIAALSILVAAISLVIPILHRISRMDSKREDFLMPIDSHNVESIDIELTRLKERIATLERLRAKIVGEQPNRADQSPSVV